MATTLCVSPGAANSLWVSHHSATLWDEPAGRKTVRWAEDENGEPHPDNFNDATGGSLVPLQIVHHVDKLGLEVLRGDDWRATETAFFEFCPRETLSESEKAERWTRFMAAIATQTDPDTAVIGQMWRALFGQALRCEEVAKPSVAETNNIVLEISETNADVPPAVQQESVPHVPTPPPSPPVVSNEITAEKCRAAISHLVDTIKKGATADDRPTKHSKIVRLLHEKLSPVDPQNPQKMWRAVEVCMMALDHFSIVLLGDDSPCPIDFPFLQNPHWVFVPAEVEAWIAPKLTKALSS